MRKTWTVLAGLAVAVLVLAGGCCSCPQKTQLFNGKDFAGWKLYLPDEKIDVNTVWQVRDGVIYCKGKPNGYMRTTRNYDDFKLHVEWRYVEEKPVNSGVFLRASGPDQVWPRCIEAQLMYQHSGDLVLINQTGITIDGKNMQDPTKQFVNIPRKNLEGVEKPAGEWNSYDIICKGDTITVFVNGVLQNAGTGATEKVGFIGLQSEGSPIEFRNIYIQPAK